MKRYLQAEMDYAVDLNTFQFVHINDIEPASKVNILYPLWENGFRERYPSDCVLTTVTTGHLNHLEFDIGRDFGQARVKFFDKKLGKKMSIRFDASQMFGAVNIMLGTRLVGMQYAIEINGVSHLVNSNFRTDIDAGARYNGINGLSQFSYFSETFSTGLRVQPYTVIYRGKELSERYRVFVRNSWGIILNDSFEFEALACFDEVSDGYLHVADFIYTVNPYFTKMMTLVG